MILDYAQYLVPSGDLGTMARGQDPNDVVRYREVSPRDLKIPDKAYADAASREQVTPRAERPEEVAEIATAGGLRVELSDGLLDVIE